MQAASWVLPQGIKGNCHPRQRAAADPVEICSKAWLQREPLLFPVCHILGSPLSQTSRSLVSQISRGKSTGSPLLPRAEWRICSPSLCLVSVNQQILALLWDHPGAMLQNAAEPQLGHFIVKMHFVIAIPSQIAVGGLM